VHETGRMDGHALPAGRKVGRGPASRLDGLLERLGVRGVIARDLLLGTVWAAVSLAALLPLLGPVAADLGVRLSDGQVIAVLAVAVVQSLLIALRRVRPVAAVLLVATLQVALVAVMPPETTARLAAPVIVAYTAGVLLPSARWIRLVGAAALLEVAAGPVVAAYVAPSVRAALGGAAAPPPDLVSWTSAVAWLVDDVLLVLLYLSAALVGAAVASRRAYVGLVESRAEAVERTREAELRAAIVAERTRMARELHDIAAHHLSGLVVQASAVERLLDRDPAAAREAVRGIRAQGKQTLDDLRQVVGVLREQSRAGGSAAGASEASVPGLAGLPELVADARALGDRVELTVEGTPAPLTHLVDVTAYRAVQEALANARQHAPGRDVSVRLVHGDDDVRLEIENGVPPASSTRSRPGYGLVGMRERTALVGGSIRAGLDGDRWRVLLVLPRRHGVDGGAT